MNEKEVIRRCQDSEKEAFDALIRTHYPYVTKYLLKLSNNADLTEDLTTCYEIIREGRAFQKEQGFEQWTETYPNRETILDDIRNRKGYVVRSNGDITGYMCIDFSGEPAYADIKGEWRNAAPYAVFYRMAFSKKYRGKGLTETAFKLIEELCIKSGVKYIRVDTDFPNARMQHVLKKERIY